MWDIPILVFAYVLFLGPIKTAKRKSEKTPNLKSKGLGFRVQGLRV